MYFYFSFDQVFPFLISSSILLCSIIAHTMQKEKVSILLLFLGTLGLGFFIARLNPFLNLWDEQYHALVAKSMMHTPFKPMLYTHPLLEYDYTNWAGNHVWMHKQPLFLWQMALSLKLFGVNELAVRIPSILMHTILTLFIYRIGKISLSSAIGYYGALFFAVAYYPLELTAGTYGTDHNDIAFLFYVTASFWAWFEYRSSGKKYWLFFIGLFSGCAVLVKWLVGLLIYAVWMLTKTVNYKEQFLKLRSYTPILICLLISAVIILPWQFYILYYYPLEANHEYALNTKHFFEAVENHSGSVWFHIDSLKLLYGEGDLMPFILLTGLITLGIKATDKIYRIALLSPVIIVYIFYSMAATKIPSFGLVVSAFIFLGLASLINYVVEIICNRIKQRSLRMLVTCMALVVVCFFLINLSSIQQYHTMWKPHDNRNRLAELAEMELIKKLRQVLPDDKYVVFNAGTTLNGHIPVMFYTNYIAYDFFPSKEQLDIIRNKGYKAVIIDLGNIPEHLMNEKDVVIVPVSD